jgi:hypothetical protein
MGIRLFLQLSDALELMFSEKVDELAIESTDGRAVSLIQFEGIMRWVHEHQNSRCMHRTSSGGEEEVAGIDVRAKLGDIVNKDNLRHDHMEGLYPSATQHRHIPPFELAEGLVLFVMSR